MAKLKIDGKTLADVPPDMVETLQHLARHKDKLRITGVSLTASVDDLTVAAFPEFAGPRDQRAPRLTKVDLVLSFEVIE